MLRFGIPELHMVGELSFPVSPNPVLYIKATWPPPKRKGKKKKRRKPRKARDTRTRGEQPTPRLRLRLRLRLGAAPPLSVSCCSCTCCCCYCQSAILPHSTSPPFPPIDSLARGGGVIDRFSLTAL